MKILSYFIITLLIIFFLIIGFLIIVEIINEPDFCEDLPACEEYKCRFERARDVGDFEGERLFLSMLKDGGCIKNEQTKKSKQTDEKNREAGKAFKIV